MSERGKNKMYRYGAAAAAAGLTVTGSICVWSIWCHNVDAAVISGLVTLFLAFMLHVAFTEEEP